MKDLRFVSPHIRGKNPLRVLIHPRKKGIKPIKIAIRKIAHRIQERKVRLAKTFRGHTADLIRHFRRPPPLYDIAIIHQIFRLSITSCAICVSFSGNVCYTECVEIRTVLIKTGFRFFPKPVFFMRLRTSNDKRTVYFKA